MGARTTGDTPGAMEKRWRSIAENPFDFVVVIGRDYKYRFVNHVASGIRESDLIGKATPFDFVDRDQHGPMRAALDKAFNEGVATSYDVYVAALDRWFSSVVGPIEEAGVVTEASILTRDITESKRAVVELEANELRLRLALEAAGAGLFDLNEDTGEVVYSATLYVLLGYAPGDHRLASDVRDFYERVHPDDSQRAMHAMQRTGESGEPFDAEYRMRTASGAYRWFHGRGRLVAPSPDGARHFIGILTDITERKSQQSERERLEEQLWNVQKMETVGTMAGGIAHDVNNALVPILGCAELALKQMGETHPAQEYLEGIIEAAERARDLLQQVLTFSRRTESKPVPVQVEDSVVAALRLMHATLPKNARLETFIEPAAPAVTVDPMQLDQIVTNLCANSIHALEGQPGEIEVHVKSVRVTTPTVKRSGVLTSGTYVEIIVKDTGTGIAPDEMDRVLEPFYTTKRVGVGTGLGLSVVHGIVARRGGAIDIQSEPGRGASFHVYLPAAGERQERPASSGGQPVGQPSGYRVMLVDDDRAVATIQARTLRALGHSVVVAYSAEDALAQFSDEEIDLVLTDHRMPGMSGLDLARVLRDRRIDLPIIIASGFLEAEAEVDAEALGHTAFLRKPYRVAALEAAVNAAFRRKG